ncbi:hypothetical protein BVRB_5g098570 [Beta vulgaris subsp. vulgaris]|nr:hypothetical protein BVRB_5g098570 [Beta vulgaris subsp. vulgaris]
MRCIVSSSPLSPSIFTFSNESSPKFLQLTTSQQQHKKVASFVFLSSSNSSSVVEDQQDSSSVVQSVNNDNNFSGCKACGREQIEGGCNGEGRIQGGIATFPGLGWWPIKAYRPCPGFLASGGNYRRRGQSMDEVAFGGGRGRPSMDNFDELETGKKGKNRNQVKAE